MRGVGNDLSCGAPIRHPDANKKRAGLVRDAFLVITIFLALSAFDTSPAIATAATAASAKRHDIDYTCICCATKKVRKKGKAHQGR